MVGCCYTLRKDRVYASINAPFNPDILSDTRARTPAARARILHADAREPVEDNPDDLRKIGWVTEPYLYLALMPRFHPYNTPLFEWLRPLKQPTIQMGRFEWRLRADVTMTWNRLEYNLRVVLKAMWDLCANMSYLFKPWPIPSRFGFLRAASSRVGMEVLASESRDAFLPLIAAISFHIVILNYRQSKLESYGKFNWRDAVLKKTGFHPQWLEELELSAAGDFRVPRVGAFFNAEMCRDSLFLLPRLAALGVPLHVDWGTLQRVPPPIGEESARYYPTAHVMKELSADRNTPSEHVQVDRLRDRSPRLTPQNKPLSTSQTAPPPPRHFPPPEPNCGQRHGEHWKDFFVRRDLANHRRTEQENDAQRATRQQREEHAARDTVPGRKGARVFYWEEREGFRIRVYAGRSHYPTY